MVTISHLGFVKRKRYHDALGYALEDREEGWDLGGME